jgi:hypothetical protein
VPQVVDLDRPELVATTDSVERADQIARLDRAAGPGGEDEPVVLPSTAQLGTVGGLRLASEVEHRLCDRQQREVSAARCRLERYELQLPLDPLDLLADPDFAVVLVDVAPAQPEHFTAAQAVEQ